MALGLMIVLCPLPGLNNAVDAARLELRGRTNGTAGEVRIPLNQSGTIDVWLDAEGERLRTLNLYLRYDPEVIRPIDAHPEIDGVNPFTTASYMPVPDEVFNAAIEDEGELYYAVTNGGNAAGNGAGVVASFRVESFLPKLASQIEIDFRFPLNFTSYQILDDEGHLEDGDFERSDVVDIRISIGEGLVVSDIPNFQLAGGAVDNSLSLDHFVTDAIYGDDQIAWSVSGDRNVEVFIDSSRRVTFEAPGNWSGVEELLFTAVSPDELTASDAVQVTVIGPPRLHSGPSGLPDIVMAEDTKHDQFTLDNYVVPDAFNPVEELSWFASGQTEIQVQIDAESHHLTLTPSAHWHGQETIVFQVMNQFGLSETIEMVVTVTPVNDTPAIEPLGDLLVLVNEEMKGPILAELVQDADNRFEELEVFVDGDAFAAAEVRDGRIVLRGLEAGEAEIRIVVQDSGGERAEATMAVTVIERYFPPVISTLADTNVHLGGRLTFDLDDLSEDPDTPDSLLAWSAVSVGGSLDVEIDAQRRVLLRATGGTGVAQVRFTVTDRQGNSDGADLNVTVLAAPELAVPDLELIVGIPQVVDLREGTIGIDPGQLTWELPSGEPLDLVLELDPDSGRLTLTASSLLAASAAVEIAARSPTEVSLADTFFVTVRPEPAAYSLAIVDTVFDAGTSLVLELPAFTTGPLPEDLVWKASPVAATAVTTELDSLGGRLVLAAGADVVDTVLVAVEAGASFQEVVRDTFLVEAKIGIDLVLQLPDTSMVAGTTLGLDLNDFTSGRDPAEMIWGTTGTLPSGVIATLDSSGVLAVAVAADLSGTLNLEIIARTGRDDPIHRTLRIAVTPPRLVLPTLDLVAGTMVIVELSEYVPVVDPADLVWELSGAIPPGLLVELEAESGRLVLNVEPGLSDTLRQQVAARHTTTLVLRDTLMMAIASQRFSLSDVGGLEIVAGAADTVLVLDDLVTSGDPAALEWAVAGEAVISIQIEPETRQLRIGAPAAFVGEETLLLTASHLSGEEVSVVMRVGVRAPEPELLLDDVPDVLLVAGDTLSLPLNGYISIGDSADVNWSAAATFVGVTIDAATGVASLTTAGPRVSGQDVLLSTATDGAGNSAGDLVRVTVNARLMLGAPAPLRLESGETAAIDLDELVASGPATLLQWGVEGAEAVAARVDNGDGHLLIVEAPTAGSGEEILTLTAVSPGGQVTTAMLSVAFAPALLVLTPLPEITLVAGADTTLVLDDLLVEVPAVAVTWSATAASLELDLAGSALVIAAPAGFTGHGLVRLTATAGGETLTDSLVVAVMPALPRLQLADMPAVELIAGGIDSTLFLDAFLEIGDPAVVEWSVAAAELVQVAISEDNRRVRISAGQSAGIDTLVFTAGVGDTSASATSVVRIAAPLPELELVEFVAASIQRGVTDSTLALTQFIAVGDADAIVWAVTGGGRVIATPAADGRLILDARNARSGRELFTVEGRHGAVSRTALLRLSITDPFFIIAPLPELEIEAGQRHASLDLDAYVKSDFELQEIFWSVFAGPELSAAVDPGTHVLALTPAADFTGAAQVLLRARTPLQDSLDVALRLNVLGPPAVLALPELFLLAGTDADVIDLDDYAATAESLVWRVTDAGEVAMAIDGATNLLRVSIPVSFSGVERRLLAARRSAGALEREVDLVLTVRALSQMPVLQLPSEVVFAVGESARLDLDALIADTDTADDAITWSISSQWQELVLEMDAGRQLTVTAPEVTSLDAVVDLRATDPEGNIAFGDFRVRVVNLDAEPPRLRLIPSTHDVFAELLNVDLFVDELLSGLPSIQLDGQPVTVSNKGDRYTAVLAVGGDRILQVGARAKDVAGNNGVANIAIAVQLVDVEGGTVFSPDGLTWMNIPGSAAPRLGMLHAVGDPAAGAAAGKRNSVQNPQVYRMQISGGVPDEVVEVAFAYDFNLATPAAPANVLQRWDDIADHWEDLTTFASPENGLLYSSVGKLGLFRMGEGIASAPQQARDLAAFPNPFNSMVAIRYLVQEPGTVKVQVYDQMGVRIRTLAERRHDAGPWTTFWDGLAEDGRRVASGIYLVVAETTTSRVAAKVTLVR